MRFRTKIVLWYGVIVLATLVAFRLASVGVIRELLYSDLDDSLRAEAAWVERVIRDYRSRGVPESEIIAEVAERSRLSPRKEFIEVLDASAGRVVFRSANLEGESLQRLARPHVGEPWDTRLRGTPVRVLVEDASDLWVAVGYPLTDVEAVIDRLLESLLYLIPLALLLAGAGGFFLASRFLRPIEEMERYADRVVALPLDQDLPPVPAKSDDEIGRLLTRIHDVVARMRKNLRRAIGFSSLASHELRTPLTILRSQMEGALRPDAGEEELREVIASTYDEVLRLGSVVEGLLDLSTLEARTLRLDRVPIDFAAFLDDFVEDVRPLCEARDVDLILDRRGSAIYHGDPPRLRQVLSNLVDNALKHVGEGGRILLESDVEDGCAVLVVEDDGTGIPPPALERIFDPFYRASAGSEPSGTGLGLALVRWIVEAHGGSVGASSRPGEGTRFTLRFPLPPSRQEAGGSAPEPA